MTSAAAEVLERSFGAGGPLEPAGWLERVNPARTDEVVGRLSIVDAAGVDETVTSAHAAFATWSVLPPGSAPASCRTAARA